MNRLTQLTDADARRAATCARNWFVSAHPEFQVSDASLIAAEPDRFVFAVFYSVPLHPTRPGPYRLLTVDRASTEVAEFNPPRDSQYWLRGRK